MDIVDISAYHKNTTCETLMLIKTYVLTQIIAARLFKHLLLVYYYGLSLKIMGFLIVRIDQGKLQ